ncbi:MAG: glycosyltransferase family 4 protein [Candidatus Omnitrophica bacterium]|nr:glycosyltransferase family 4 protein [Candidatus Omnitrophota bacterium]MDD5552958.1 glycosyltransferase family 4 protein [Candidatus Omnitrophota bacterium]
MKIAVLGTRGFPSVQGGVEAHCENLYPRLAAGGCKITAFTRAAYAADPSLKRFNGVDLAALTCPKNKFLEALFHTFKGVLRASRIKADIVHIHASGPALCVPLAKLLGMKVVMTSHGAEHLRDKWKGLAKYALLLGEYLGVSFADAVISVSKSNARRLIRKYKRKISFVPNGVNIPKMAESSGILNRLGLSKGRYLLTVGRFVPEKGFIDLIGAFRRLNRDDLKLVIAGRADHEDGYSRKLKKEAAENPGVILAGFLSGLPLRELYSHAGLFVLPSYYEGLPIALLEALSFGLSCIASDIPANKEAPLTDERFFTPGDIGQIGEKINKFINAPLSQSEKEAQLTRLNERYNWDVIAGRILEIYKGLYIGKETCARIP